MFGALQVVANMRLQEQAKAEGEHLFSWKWSDLGSSTGIIEQSDILKKTETDATVRVKGTENVTRVTGRLDATKPDAPVACSAVLTFYRKDREWMLGKVQFE
jgi:hypothetical protein